MDSVKSIIITLLMVIVGVSIFSRVDSKVLHDTVESLIDTPNQPEQPVEEKELTNKQPLYILKAER